MSRPISVHAWDFTYRPQRRRLFPQPLRLLLFLKALLLILFLKKTIYLTVWDLNCGTWDLPLQQEGFSGCGTGAPEVTGSVAGGTQA